MDENSIYLFVYGTLLDDNNSFAAYLRAHAAVHCSGNVKGKLHSIGDYPGAIFDGDAKEFVYGSIYTLDVNTSVLLKALDAYEGFGESFEHPNEFVRELIVEETGQGPIVAGHICVIGRLIDLQRLNRADTLGKPGACQIGF